MNLKNCLITIEVYSYFYSSFNIVTYLLTHLFKLPTHLLSVSIYLGYLFTYLFYQPKNLPTYLMYLPTYLHRYVGISTYVNYLLNNQLTH
jgi:hypothetical protein